jgi:hypothetical protein
VLDSLRADVRLALRQAARSPAFSGTVVATIALTVGASTVLFSVYNGLVLRSLPVRDPSRVVLVQPIDEKGRNRPLYHETYEELRKLPVFEHLALYSGGGLMINEARGSRVEGLIEAVTPGLFETLGLHPHHGRFFVEDDFTNIAIVWGRAIGSVGVDERNRLLSCRDTGGTHAARHQGGIRRSD